jgi:hypothetical protein
MILEKQFLSIHITHSDFRGKEDILANYVLRNGSVGVGVDAVLWHDYIGTYSKYFYETLAYWSTNMFLIQS